VKARVLIILVFLLGCVMAFGQGPDSFVYVKQFPGKDVGTKVANAMQTCNTNPVITCYLAIDPSLAIYAPGTMPTLCSHCVLYDWRGGIPGGVSNISLFIQTLDPTHLPVTQNGNVTDLNLANVDKVDLANTHTTGTQTVLTGTPGTVGRVLQGIGTSVGNFISTNYSNTPCWNGNVSVGQFALLVEQNRNGGLATPTSALGNTLTAISTSNQTGLYYANITVAGAETLCSGAGDKYVQVALFSGIASGSPIASFQVLPQGVVSGANGWTFNLTPTGANQIVALMENTEQANCAFTPDPSMNTVFNLTSTLTGSGLVQLFTSANGNPLTFNVSASCAGGDNSAAQVIVALKSSTTFSQSADFDRWENAMGRILSHVDANGSFDPPQVAGVPGWTPDAGTIAYDTTNHCTRVYDTVTGWTCIGTSSPLTAGTNGYYRIEGDATITDYVNTGALNNNTPTTVPLPHSFPSLIASITCTDNGGRVQAGNDQAVGANVVGLSAPFSSIYVNSPATGMSAYCIVVGK
jgi:hypothetical protein